MTTLRTLPILLLLLLTSTARALSPESTFLVVNPQSWASLTVASRYAHLRHIPDANILLLPFKLERKDDQTTVDTFREKLLKPVLAAIKDRKLDKQIDCIAWSSDFPTAIDFSADLPPKPPTTRNRQYPVASLNGLTFLYQQVLAKDAPAYASLKANHYYRATNTLPDGKFDVQPTIPFSAQTPYDGRRHMLSIVLGVTSGRGNSVSEVLACLTRAAAADFTHPKGAFYYSVNDNIRSKTRQWAFDAAIEKLAAINQEALRDTDTFPKNKNDILGAMLGLIHPKQENANSQTLPGAIVENLTSEGGVMNWSANQTPLSSFIRHGAAGSSGTVIEPYALQPKFPTPFLFYHYAAGATLIEAYYQSVQGPYQLLIVGDPLCQPFAKRTTPIPFEDKFLTTLDKLVWHPRSPLPALTVTLPEGQAFIDGPALTSGPITHIVEDMRRKPALQDAKIPPGDSYRLEAYFDADIDDLYQFQIFTDGKAALTVDNISLGDSIEKTWTFLPISLARGKHKLTVTGTAGPARDLTIRFGGGNAGGSRDIGKRTRDFDAENPALHFAHIAATTPAPTTRPSPAHGTP